MPPPHGGVSTNMLAIHETLLQNGHDSVIVDVTDRNANSGADKVLKPGSAPGLIRLLLKLDCDIVHYHIGGDFNTKLAFLTLFCGLLPGKKSVVTFHSGGFAKKVIDSAKPFSLRGFAFRSIDLLAGVNPQMIEMFGRYGVPKKRTSLVLPFELRRPNPTQTIPSALGDCVKNADPFLLSVGALEREYLNSFLIESMPAIVRKFPNARLLIAGSGSMETQLENKIREMGLSETIFLAGNVDHPVLLHLIEKADALLRLTEFDGDAISVREALFLGTPVVVTDNGMRPEGVHMLAEPINSADLVDQLTQALAREREPVRHGVVESNAEKMVEIYKELLAK